MFYKLKCAIKIFFACIITVIAGGIYVDYVLIWVLVKWVHGLFYKAKHGYKPYSKLWSNLPTAPKFGKLFKLPPKPKKPNVMCYEEYVMGGHWER